MDGIYFSVPRIPLITSCERNAFDYSDLPLFDSIRGTFRNPKEFVTEIGLYDVASSKIKQMILFEGTNNEVT